jgi:tripartite-type tricarboxylate transporter receptor subunit TctC
MLVPAAAGGSTDRGARVIARLMSVHLRQPIVVENKAGGGGRIAPYEAARATPDGYTILFGNSIGNALLPAVVKKINYDPLKDFKPIGIALSYATLLTCNKRKGLSSFDKFKTHPASVWQTRDRVVATTLQPSNWASNLTRSSCMCLIVAMRPPFRMYWRVLPIAST